MPVKIRFLAIVLLLFMGTVWGAVFSLAKIAIDDGATPLGMVLWQVAFGGLFLLAIAMVRGHPPSLSLPVVRFNLVCGFVGSTLPSVGLYAAAVHLSAGVISIAVAFMPLATYALSLLCRIEKLSPVRFLGIVFGFAAVALLVLPEDSLPQAGLAPWVLLAIGASSGYAVENIYIALRRPPGLDSLGLGCGRQLAAAVILGPLVLVADQGIPLLTSWGPLQWVVTAMAIGSALAYTCFLVVIKLAGPVFASLTAYLVTIAGIFWGMALFGERHSHWIWLALAMMLCGVALVRPRQRREVAASQKAP
ncbi:MAG: DMT family transporter [Pseudomonadota bacterium]